VTPYRQPLSKTVPYRFQPKWRQDNNEWVEVVSSPDSTWFQNLTDCGEGRLTVRFALMENGRLYFGDAFHIVHYDIMQLREPTGEHPLLVGVILRSQGIWRLANVQYFLSSNAEDGSKSARGLLPMLIPWNEAIEALGSNPLSLPNWGEIL